jgi:cbb3-type cytochrome oxidase subunit 3
MENLLTWRFWFNLRPEALLPLFTKLFLAWLLILLIAAVISALKQRQKSPYKNIWKKSYVFSLSNFLIGGILIFFNYERAAFLSARFWLALWLIVMILWLIPIFKAYRLIPLRKKEREQEQEFKKYLP